MRLSRASQYAILAMAQLEHDPKAPPVPCSALSKLGGMPERFLLQILRTLVNAGLVKSTRGVDGGYRLASSPSGISLADIVEAVDGPFTHEPAEALAALPKKAKEAIASQCQAVAEETRTRLAAVRLSTLKATAS